MTGEMQNPEFYPDWDLSKPNPKDWFEADCFIRRAHNHQRMLENWDALRILNGARDRIIKNEN